LQVTIDEKLTTPHLPDRSMLTALNAIIFFALIALLRHRHGKKFDGTSAVSVAGSYQYNEWIVNHGNNLSICIDAPEGISCDFIPERWFHRLLKKIGLTREHQIGHPKFDDALYIQNDQNAIGQRLKENLVIAQAALHLMDAEALAFRFESMSIQNGKIKVSYRNLSGFKSLFGPQHKLQNHQLLANHSLRALQSIVFELQGVTDPASKQAADVSFQRATFVSILSIGLFSCALISKFVLQPGGDPLLLDSGQLFHDAANWSFGLTTGMLLITAGAVWRSSRAHVTIFQSVFFGGLGIWGNVHTTMQILNSEWADQKPQVKTVLILDRSIKQYKKHTTFFLTLRVPTGNSQQRIEVSEKIYYNTGSHASLNLTLQEGALGYLIIKKIDAS
jgi:hypothetical protein